MKIIGISALPKRTPEAEVTVTSPIAAEMSMIWQTVLDVPAVHPTDHFFELGGDSLGMTRVAARIRETFGVEVPLATLFQNPTLESMICQVEAVLRGEDGMKLSPLLALRTSGHLTPLFCFHGQGAATHDIFKLSRLLDQRQVYCFNIWHLETYASATALLPDEAHQHLPYTVEQLAMIFIRNIKAIQPSGPYLLYGYSFGGFVMYEVAQQLRAQGDEIGMLLLIDAYPPRPVRRDAVARLQNVRYWLSDELSNFRTSPRPYLQQQYLRIKKIVIRVWKGRMPRVEVTQLAQVLDRNSFAAALAYQAKPLCIPATHFRASKRPLYEPFYTWNWEALLGRHTRRIMVEGNHVSIFHDQHIPALASGINSVLAAADPEFSTPTIPYK